MRTLAIGPSGAGKTYLSQEFRNIGINAIDADEINGLSSWYYQDQKVNYPQNADENFFNNHSFRWDINFLARYLEDKPNIIIFGMSGNAFEMIKLFDKVYFLDLPDETIQQRLQSKSRKNPMGKTPFQRENAVRYANELRKQALKLGVEFIDTTLPLKELLTKIK